MHEIFGTLVPQNPAFSTVQKATTNQALKYLGSLLQRNQRILKKQISVFGKSLVSHSQSLPDFHFQISCMMNDTS
jgi:hypothetical protein